MKQKRWLDQVGLRFSRQALRVLKERGIFVQAAVSLEHQHLAKRYVVRGVTLSLIPSRISAFSPVIAFCSCAA